MPFTLAHPAAVLPLKRFSPRWLDFPALVIGSLVPDSGYLFNRWGADALSHSAIGSLVYCLPVGLLVTAAFYLLRTRLVSLLPQAERRLFIPLCEGARAAWPAIVLSVLLGVSTHLLWDAVTHKDGWLVERVPALQMALFMWGYRTVRLAHVLWYLCSFAGAAWLHFRFERWRCLALGQVWPQCKTTALVRATIVGFLVLIIAVIHNLISGWSGKITVAVLVVLLLAGVVFWRPRSVVRVDGG